MNPQNSDILNSHTFIDEMIYCPGGNLFSVVSQGYDDTIAIARVFASFLADGDIVCMDGDLGAGKTAFASGIASGLGIGGVVPSPTFTILHEYSIPENSQGHGIRAFYHFDVYRLSGDEDFYSCGFDEYLGSPGSVCVVEWADKIRGVFAPEAIQVLLFRPETSTGMTDADADAPDNGESTDVSGQERKILFYFPAGDDRADRLCLSLQRLHFIIG